MAAVAWTVLVRIRKVFDVRDQQEKVLQPLTKKGAKLISISANDLFIKSNYQDFERYTEVDIALAADPEATLPSLIEACKRLVTASTEVQGEMTALIEMIAHPPEVLIVSNNQHRRLLEALRKRDEQVAMGVMLEHLHGTEHVLAGLMPSL